LLAEFKITMIAGIKISKIKTLLNVYSTKVRGRRARDKIPRKNLLSIDSLGELAERKNGDGVSTK